MTKILDTNFKENKKFNVIFNSPHSGSLYTKEFIKSSKLNIHDLRTSEDAFVGELFNSARTSGCLFIEAKFPRSFVDLNRSHLELDPKLISGDFHYEKTVRNMAGLGVIPRMSGNGKEIYNSYIFIDEVIKRLKVFYFPYHRFLEDLIFLSKKRLGYAIIFDCHSMPSNLSVDFKNSKKNNASDIILGDVNGTSCSSFLTKKVKTIFERHDFLVTTNYPFSGGFITKNYGKPENSVHVIQIEVNKKLYMDEEKIKKNKNFENFQRKIQSIIEELSFINLFDGNDNIAAE